MAQNRSDIVDASTFTDAIPCKLRGSLDHVTRGQIAGWARDEAHPDVPVVLRVLDNGVVLGTVVADRERQDLVAAEIGTGRHAFSLIITGGLSPNLRHVINVQRVTDGRDIPLSPCIVDASNAEVLPITTAPTGAVAGSKPGAPNRSSIDHLTRTLIQGWAYDEMTPEIPVSLQVLDNGIVIGRVLANRYRADLANAEVGRGQHGFEFAVPGGFSPLERHIIQVRRESDGIDINKSPWVIEPSASFDPALMHTVSKAITALTIVEDQQKALDFLVAQTERVLQQRADADGQRAERIALLQFRRRWGPSADASTDSSNPGLRALVIDDRIAVTGRDAGSQALLSHIRAMQRLGYAVSFAAAAEMGTPAPALAITDITVCGAPFYSSVEDVLRRQAGCFDVVYLHRADTAARYLALVRHYCPRARLLYSVADLHHIRLQRQSVIEDRPELMAHSHRMRLAECTAAWLADAVITHSTNEGELLRQMVPQANVYHVPWDLPIQSKARSFAARQGVAFIGSYGHAPNIDAACFLTETIMPLVWRSDPTIGCLLVGSSMPESIKRLAGPGIAIAGQVDDLWTDLFDRIRLTVAPMRYGAGVKGKVLESLAAGIPCVMSPIAAEGLPLPSALHAFVGNDAADMAGHICRLHVDQTVNDAVAAAGLAMMQRNFNEDIVTQSLQAAIEGRRPITI